MFIITSGHNIGSDGMHKYGIATFTLDGPDIRALRRELLNIKDNMVLEFIIEKILRQVK